MTARIDKPFVLPFAFVETRYREIIRKICPLSANPPASRHCSYQTTKKSDRPPFLPVFHFRCSATVSVNARYLRLGMYMFTLDTDSLKTLGFNPRTPTLEATADDIVALYAPSAPPLLRRTSSSLFHSTTPIHSSGPSSPLSMSSSISDPNRKLRYPRVRAGPPCTCISSNIVPAACIGT